MQAHILVVEDDDTARFLLADRLHYAGYRVTQASGGEAALDLLEQQTFDVVLTDIVMDQTDGIEVLHTARLQPYHPVVILLTGHGSLETSIAALRAGAFDYLLKPCNEDLLLACVARAVQRHRTEQHLAEATALLTSLHGSAAGGGHNPATGNSLGTGTGVARSQQPLCIGCLVVGDSRRAVTADGEPVRLTPIEYALLQLLAAHSGTVQTYRQMVHWTHNLDTTEAEAQALLRVHIYNLRKKLPDGYLVNDRGIGYKLVAPDNLSTED